MTSKRAVQDFVWVAGPKVLGGALQFAFSLILLRYLGPGQFGIVSVCLATVLLSDSIIGGATDSGVLRFAPLLTGKSPDGSLQYQQAGLLLKLAVAIPLAAPVLWFAEPLSRLLFQEVGDAQYLVVSMVALLAMLALRSAQMHFQVNQRFVAYGASDLLNSGLKFGGLALLILLAQPTPFLVLALYAAAPLAVTFVLLALSARAMITTRFSTSAFAELAGTAKWYIAIAATGTIIARMDIFMVSSIASVSEAGIFSAAQAIALVPQLVGTYVAVVFSPRIMPMWEAGTLKSLYRRFQLAITAAAGLLFVAAWLLLPFMTQWVFPAAFARSSDAILVLLPAGLAALVNFPLTILLLLFLRPKTLLALDFVLLPVLIAAYALVIPELGAIGAAAVSSISALVKTAIMQVLGWRLLNESPVPAEPPLARRAHAEGKA